MTGFPGNAYWDPERQAWTNPQAWEQAHSINPETGLLDGPYPLPPAGVARGYQALHDRAIWQRQQGYMDDAQRQLRDATRFQQGALGLLQSYRPGGSAALEAGIYDRTAGGMRAQAAGSFQRAQMTQPLDLLGDLRRHEGAQARKAAQQANELAFIGSLIGSGVQTYAATQGGQPEQEGAGQRFSGGDGGGAGGGGGDGAALSSSLSASEQSIESTGYVDSPTQPGGPQPASQPPQQQGSPFQAPQQQPDGSGVQTTVEPFQQPMQSGPGGQAPSGSPQPGAGGMPGDPAPIPVGMPAGADRDFSQDSFAAVASQTQYDSPFAPMVQVSMNNFLADLYESDPFYQSMPVAVQSRWNERLYGQEQVA